MLEHAKDFARAHAMLPEGGGLVLAAVSGGADSVCLLHWLAERGREQNFKVAAAHYNHHLRGEESQRDEDFVRALAQKWEIPLTVDGGQVGEIAAQRGRGVEETARELRYAFLRETAQTLGAAAIATAHNADDNGETMLLHLIRGTGLRGLAGITPKGSGLIRPFLTTERGEIEDYLRERGIDWVEDSTNRDEYYARNRLRSQVMPVLRELNPAAVRHMGAAAAIVRGADGYLEEEARRMLDRAELLDGSMTVATEVLTDAPEIAALYAVQQMARRVRPGISLTETQRKSVLRLARSEQPSGQIDLPGELVALRRYEALVLTTKMTLTLLAGAPLSCPGRTEAGDYIISVEEAVFSGEPQGDWEFWLSREKTAAGLEVTARRVGDMLKRPGRRTKAVKKLLIDEKIPRNTRDGLPAIRCAGRLAAFAGLGPDRGFLPEAGETAWRIKIERKNMLC